MVKTYNPIISETIIPEKLNIPILKKKQSTKKQSTKKKSNKKTEKMSQINEYNFNHFDEASTKKSDKKTEKISQINDDKADLKKSKLTNEILKLVNKKYIFTEKCPQSITFDLLSEIIPSYYDKSEFNKDSLWVSYYTTMNLQSYNHKPKHISFDELK